MKLIVLEGLDGSGKATQAARLAEHLAASGERSLLVSFPNYESDSSALVRMYLSGALGEAGQVNAYAASSFYAADRYISFETGWKKEYLAGYTIVADRYATSNAAHQMSKLPREEWDDYLRWLEDYEYDRMKLPRPDLVLYLDMHPDISHTLIVRRGDGNGENRDIHEEDLGYLRACREAALYAGRKLGWRILRCYEGGEPLPVDKVFAAILRLM